MEFQKYNFQSLRLQRTSVVHSVRKNEKALRSYLIFLRNSSNWFRNGVFLIPFSGFNSIIHRCIINKNLNEIFTKKDYYFHCHNTEQKIIILNKVLISLTTDNMLDIPLKTVTSSCR
jgi:hypothetical protein